MLERRTTMRRAPFGFSMSIDADSDAKKAAYSKRTRADVPGNRNPNRTTERSCEFTALRSFETEAL
jgi:hypothetical protein